MDKKNEFDLGSVPSAGVVFAPGCKENTVSDSKVSGFETAVWLGGSTDGGPQGNVVTRIEAKRFQDDVSVSDQAKATASSAPQSPEKNDPWYKQLAVQVAGGIILLAAGSLWAWLGFPTAGS